MNNKANRVKFVNDVKAYLLKQGATVTHEDYTNTEVFTLGNCTLRLRAEEDHKNIYTIFARFTECNSLSGSMNPKYNFHSIHPEFFKGYIDSIVNYLNQIPKTKEEKESVENN